MFERVLKEVVDGSAGAMAALVMDTDGITLASYAKESSTFDIATVGVELSVVIKSVVQAAEMLEAGQTSEMSIVSDELVTVVRMVNRMYFVALSMEPGGNLGKARYLLRTKVPEMVDELS